MIHWRYGRVVRRLKNWTGASEVLVALETPLPRPGRAFTAEPAEEVHALAYTDMVGDPPPGARVLLNVSALAKGLGTGGLALVVATPDDLPADPASQPGHIVKARYSPLQNMVLAVDEQDSEHHDLLVHNDSIAGMPCVIADLHSALPAVIAGIRASHKVGKQLRVVYIMTDQAALPAAFSRTIAALRDAEWLSACITVGQAWGGDYEAITVHSALLAAKHVLNADIAVISQGPGNVGTGTPYGFTGMASADHVHAATLVGGTPIAMLRVSGADQRERHYGISHHTLTAIGHATLVQATIPVPDFSTLEPEEAHAYDLDTEALLLRLRHQLPQLQRHHIVEINLTGLLSTLRGTPVSLSTMGRTLEHDAPAFLAAAAAGSYAASYMS